MTILRTNDTPKSTFRWPLLIGSIIATFCCLVGLSKGTWVYGYTSANTQHNSSIHHYVSLWGVRSVFDSKDTYHSWSERCTTTHLDSFGAKQQCDRMLLSQKLVLSSFALFVFAALSATIIVIKGGLKIPSRIKYATVLLAIVNGAAGLLLFTAGMKILLMVEDWDEANELLGGFGINKLRCSWASYVADIGNSLGLVVGFLYFCRPFEILVDPYGHEITTPTDKKEAILG